MNDAQTQCDHKWRVSAQSPGHWFYCGCCGLLTRALAEPRCYCGFKSYDECDCDYADD